MHTGISMHNLGVEPKYVFSDDNDMKPMRYDFEASDHNKQIRYHPSKHKTLSQCWLDVGTGTSL